MNLIKIKNLSKIYFSGKQNQIQALKDINLEIKKGDFLAIMGPSGSGKSTLMHIIGCLDKPSKGVYALEGENIINKSANDLARIRNQKIGFIFQTFSLLPRYSVLANVILPQIYSKRVTNKKQRAQKVLTDVNLANRINHKPNQLSGGEQQRTAIARALVNDPEIILADEPTGNLDEKSAKEIIKILKKLNSQGKTIILVTHDPELAKNARRIIKLKHGENIK